MSTCPPNLTHSFLTVFLIIKFKVDEIVFFYVPMGDNKVFKAQKTIFLSRHGLSNFIFMSLGELGTFLQNFIPTRGVEHQERKIFHNGVC
jgi:hypothetical protein